MSWAQGNVTDYSYYTIYSKDHPITNQIKETKEWTEYCREGYWNKFKAPTVDNGIIILVDNGFGIFVGAMKVIYDFCQ